MVRACRLFSLACLMPALWLTAQQAAPVARQESSAPHQGAEIFASHCSGCHGSDGHGGGGAPNIATSRDVRELSDSELLLIVRDGISGAGMPAFGSMGKQKVEAAVVYLRILQGKGSGSVNPSADTATGQALFFGKAHCSECHMVNGKGGFIAGDLTGYGQGMATEKIVEVITQPNKEFDPRSEVVTVTTHTGSKFIGMIKSEDNNSISLQSIDGYFHFLLKSSLVQVDHSSRSLMPDNYKATLSEAELNALAGYLTTVARNQPTPAPNEK